MMSRRRLKNISKAMRCDICGRWIGIFRSVKRCLDCRQRLGLQYSSSRRKEEDGDYVATVDSGQGVFQVVSDVVDVVDDVIDDDVKKPAKAESVSDLPLECPGPSFSHHTNDVSSSFDSGPSDSSSDCDSSSSSDCGSSDSSSSDCGSFDSSPS